MTLSQVLADCLKILPEIILVLTLCAVILADILIDRSKKSPTEWITLAGLTLALGAIGLSYGNGFHSVMAYDNPAQPGAPSGGPMFGFSRMLVVDTLSDFFKVIFLLGTIGVVFFTMRSTEIKGKRHGDFYALLLSTVLGGAFLVSSNNFLMLVLSLETLSLCSYVLVGYSKDNRLSAEASLKYILYGSVASGVMIFGISYIYGMAGTLDISYALAGITMRESSSLAVILAFVLVIGGLGFKMAAVPFHFWCPDVYQGAPTPVTAFLSVVSKAAGFSALYRVLLPLFSISGSQVPDHLAAVRGSLDAIVEQGHLPALFWVLSVTTMTLGNLVAIRQTDVKRLLAYSSIAHAGYILMGMTVFSHAALEAMLFYFFVYMLTNLGAFLVVILVIEKTGSSHIESYRGMGWKNPFLGIVMFIFLISLTGMPPTAGFLGKLMLFNVVIEAGGQASSSGIVSSAGWFYYSLAIIAALNTAISLFYYMNIMQMMFFRKPTDETDTMHLGMLDKVYLLVYCIPVLFLIMNFAPALALADLFR